MTKTPPPPHTHTPEPTVQINARQPNPYSGYFVPSILTIVFLVLQTFIVGCSDPSSPYNGADTIAGTKFSNTVAVARPAKITQTLSKATGRCAPPKKDCFENVYIDASKLTQLAALDLAIQNGTTGAFFLNSSNYNTIWNSFESSNVLADLQSEVTLLCKADSAASGTVQYYCVDSLGNSVDYSND